MPAQRRSDPWYGILAPAPWFARPLLQVLVQLDPEAVAPLPDVTDPWDYDAYRIDVLKRMVSTTRRFYLGNPHYR